MRWLATSRPVGPTIIGTILAWTGASWIVLTIDASGLLDPGYIVLWTVAGVLNLGAGVAMLAVRPWARLACLVVLTCDIIVSIASAILFPQGLWEGQLWATLFAILWPTLMIGYLLSADARRSLAPDRRTP